MMTNYNYFQESLPVFVRKGVGLKYNGVKFTIDQEFPWVEMGVPYEIARSLFISDQIYHNPSLVVQNDLGDKLDDCTLAQLQTFVNLMNTHIKSLATTTKQAHDSRIKKSKNGDRQKVLIRTWLNRNEALKDKFDEILDNILK